jgi:hypothetical protein
LLFSLGHLVAEIVATFKAHDVFSEATKAGQELIPDTLVQYASVDR